MLSIFWSIRCVLGDIRLWVGDLSTSSCLVFLPTNIESITNEYGSIRQSRPGSGLDFQVKELMFTFDFFEIVTPGQRNAVSPMVAPSPSVRSSVLNLDKPPGEASALLRRGAGARQVCVCESDIE